VLFQTYGWDSHGLLDLSRIKFANIATGNYAPATNSSVLSAAFNLTGLGLVNLTNDFLGNARPAIGNWILVRIKLWHRHPQPET